MTSITIGNIKPISRPAWSDVVVSSALAPWKRCDSSRSRTKARTTRMPVICSRSTRLMPSIRSCMTRNIGTMRNTTLPMARMRTGMLTASSQASPPSWRMAMTTPPMTVTGAARARLAAMTTSIWTCWTSLVIRVMSDGAPKRFISRAEKPVTRWKRLSRTSRPKPMATREPR
jgi:hypothetical protein